jgi:hypothetical protein
MQVWVVYDEDIFGCSISIIGVYTSLLLAQDAFNANNHLMDGWPRCIIAGPYELDQLALVNPLVK